METIRAPLPQSEEEFAHDARVSYDKESKQWTLQDGEKTWGWLPKYQKWTEVIDEALVKQHMDMYKRDGDDDAPLAIDVRKRKAEQQKAAAETKKVKKEPRERPNTAIYVTGIPIDATMGDIFAVFKKAGMIEEDIHTGQPKIKMYADERDDFCGDARIIYFRPESVGIAIQRFHETDFNEGGNGAMKVTKAEFTQSKREEVSADSKKKPKSKEDRYLARQKTEQMKARLADWSDDESSALPTPPNTSRYAKMVVVKHMFTLQELKDDPASLIEIKDDARTEAVKFGDVTNVVLYDEEEDGVVTIRFTEPEAAELCASRFNGRKFDGRSLVAYVPQHREQYRKSKPGVSEADHERDLGDRSDMDDDDEEAEDNGAIATTES